MHSLLLSTACCCLLLFNGAHTWKGVEWRSEIAWALFVCLILNNVMRKYSIVILGSDILSYFNVHLIIFHCCSLWRHHNPQACNPLFRDLNVNKIIFTVEFNSQEDAVLRGWSEYLICLFPFHVIQNCFGESSWQSLTSWCLLTRLMFVNVVIVLLFWRWLNWSGDSSNKWIKESYMVLHLTEFIEI